MLDALLPVALVAATVVPVHFAVSVPDIVEVVSLVSVTTSPSENPITTLLVVCVFAFVLI